MNKLLKTIKENDEKLGTVLFESIGITDMGIITRDLESKLYVDQNNIKSYIAQSRIKELEALVERVEKMKPTRNKHQDYCCYKKDTARNMNECDCNFSQYIKAIVDVKNLLKDTINQLKE